MLAAPGCKPDCWNAVSGTLVVGGSMMDRLLAFLGLTLSIPLLLLTVQPAAGDGIPIELWKPVATFSILGYDPATGEVGGAVQSRVFSVGNGRLWAEAGVGAAATQAIVDVSYGPQALALLRSGL